MDYGKYLSKVASLMVTLVSTCVEVYGSLFSSEKC